MTHALRAANEAAFHPAKVAEMFCYDGTNLLFRQTGIIAGKIHRAGYRHVRMSRKSYCAHRLIWCLIHGAWPELYVDHINGDRADNRIENLRLASHSQNLANSRSFKRNAGKKKGVTKRRDRWIAQIGFGGRNHYIGAFATEQEAHAAYLAKAKEFFGDFARAA